MPEFTVKLTNSAAGIAKELKALRLNPSGFLKVAGRAAYELLRERFAYLEATNPNKMGGERQHFWAGVRETVARPVSAGNKQIVVSVNHPVIAHKVGLGPMGGWIRPKLHKWLTIPAIKEAYGQSAKEYESGGKTDKPLKFINLSDTKAMLAEVEVSVVDGKKLKSLKVVFFLRKEVFQKGDPHILPGESLWQQRMSEVWAEYIETKAALAKANAESQG